MTVEQDRVVDAIGVENATGTVVLTISDHLGWLDNAAHLASLQAKLNTYLAYLESGEVYRSYPASRNRGFRIDIVFQHPPTESGEVFLRATQETIENAGFTLSWRSCAESSSAGLSNHRLGDHRDGSA
jgi:uncharacterized protein DUF6572